mmetsp:Transcript_109065/g.352049  ORF Transcript_109065/g.352049 Transcript_109065/m.352049 type:complete len:704 (+) Transcript_109065:74-2185(+)
MATLGRALTVCAAMSFFESACARGGNRKVSLPRPDICSGAAGWPGSCRRALGEGEDVALLQRTAVQSTLILLRAQEEECHTAVYPEPCYEAVMWAMQHGINIYPSWYPGLDKTSRFEEFQKLLHDGGHGPLRTGTPNYRECTEPCRARHAMANSTAPSSTSTPSAPSSTSASSSTPPSSSSSSASTTETTAETTIETTTEMTAITISATTSSPTTETTNEMTTTTISATTSNEEVGHVDPAADSATASWTSLPDKNCFPGHGADAIGLDASVAGAHGLEACEAACISDQGCTAFVLRATRTPRRCYLRRELCPAECLSSPAWITYELVGSLRREGCAHGHNGTSVVTTDIPAGTTGLAVTSASMSTTWFPTEVATTAQPSVSSSLPVGTTASDAVARSTAPPCTSLSSSSTDTTSTTSTTMDSTTTDFVASTTEKDAQPVNNFTWRASTDDKVGEGWCQVEVPQADWNLFDSACSGGFRLKVLSYNLFWWNLFGVRGGNGGSAGALIAQSSQTEAYDLMGFQECQNVGLVLRDAGLSDDYTGLQWSDGDIALGLAFHKGRFERLEGSTEKVAEDRPEQWYGKRGAQWVRLQDKKSKRVVFIVNHHGPLPVDSGGVCGGDATAYNLLRIFGQHAEAGDALVLVGDLNAGAGSRTQRALGERMHRVNSNWVDAIYSSCAGAAVKEEAVLANGGSDHNALFATLEF